ncbi:MAG: hypothetical protein IIB06_07800 [Bacteroidetes bacterium]|nr:hypothetical protein [Bacteroidota bacterium]
MKKTFILIVLVVFNMPTIFSQAVINNSHSLNRYKNIPQEKVFVHYNTSLLFAGEYLYYSVYTINSATNKLSTISKIAYVELIGEDHKEVFKHKIKLEKGVGQGDFFIPTSVPSGNYKLISYTNWMLNGEKNHFFQDDISIINPYKGNQEAILMDGINDENQVINTSQNSKENQLNKFNGQYISLSTDRTKYKKRENVALTIKNLMSTPLQGTYSLSVRKINTISHSSRYKATNYNSLYSKNIISKNRSINELVYLPELRGELITGSVVYKETNLPASDKKVAISISGKEFIFKISSTNNNGVFYFNLDKEYTNSSAIIQVIGSDKEKYKIEISEYPSVDYSTLEFNKFKINPGMKDIILERSIYNQIENGYFSVKPDSIIIKNVKLPFYYGESTTTYDLDDYTRFSTVKEVFVEIVKHVWTRKISNEETVFQVRSYVMENDSNLLPLIIVDDVLIQDHNHLFEYNANKIKTVSILREKYFFGTQIYQGIIAIKTIDGDYKNRLYGDYIDTIELFSPQPEKNYFHQMYDEKTDAISNRIPDFRSQLLWIPRININSEEITLQFFTSDNSGDYEICLEGFTVHGKPVSIRNIITVE